MYRTPTKPTLYFIGVSTTKSSIMRVFPAWADHLGLGDCAIEGMDFALHDEPGHYREAVAFIKSAPFAQGALVTTHKLDLLGACRDQFDELDEHAQITGEVSCISKRGARLFGHAKDVLTAGRALEAFLPSRHWLETGAEAIVLGAGGSAIAVTWYLINRSHGANRPSRVIVTDRSQARLDEIKQIHQTLGCDVPVEYCVADIPGRNDEFLASLRPCSLVINATGLGKDAPGSPLTDAAKFPMNALAWDFNYRGDLGFLCQAHAQQLSHKLHVEDGWIYFIYGWTAVIAEVFHIEIAVGGPQFEELARIAALTR